MKKVILATALVSTLAFSSVQAGPSVPQQDLNQIFSTDIQQNQVSGLSGKEMRETEGEFWMQVISWVTAAAVAWASATRPGHSPSRPSGAPTWGGW